MTLSDIADLSYVELDELRTHIDARMTELRETGVPQLRERLAAEAAALGLSIEEVVGSARKRKRRAKAQDDGGAD